MPKAKIHKKIVKAKKTKKAAKPAKLQHKPAPKVKPPSRPKPTVKPSKPGIPSRLVKAAPKPLRLPKPIKPPKPPKPPKLEPLAKSPATPKDRKLVKQCADVIHQLLPEAQIIFFGSRARGRSKEDSDLDLLVLTERPLGFQDEMRLLDAVFPLEYDSGVIICPIVEQKNRWYSNRWQAMPLARAITKHGVKL